MAELSGVQWCDLFPTSKSLDDLVEPFRTNATKFVSALTDGSSTVIITDTLRPPERVHLMHYACRVGGYTKRNGVFVPPDMAAGDVPAMDGVDIDWTWNGNPARARVAAVAMVKGYGIVFLPSLTSLHPLGRAVDMTITVPDMAQIMDADGKPTVIHGKANGSDSRIVAIGATYGVIKLATDPPHWSDNGH